MLSPDGKRLHVLTLAPKVEAEFLAAQGEGGEEPRPLEPAWLNSFYDSLGREVRRVMEEGHNPVLLVSRPSGRMSGALWNVFSQNSRHLLPGSSA